MEVGRDALPLLLGRVQRPDRQVALPAAGFRDDVQHVVEGADQRLHVLVGQGRGRGASAQVARAHPVGRVLQPFQRGQRQPQDDCVGDHHGDAAEKGEQDDAAQSLGLDQARCDQCAHDRNPEHDRQIGDHDLVEQG